MSPSSMPLRLPPRPPLDRCVDFFWVADTYRARTSRERVLASGAQVLVIPLEGQPIEFHADAQAPLLGRFFDGVLFGARHGPSVIGTGFGATVGIHFKPGGARPFFDLPADELQNQAAPLEALWGHSGRLLREQLAQAPGSRERVGVLESFLIARAQRLERPQALHEALRAFEEPGLPSVAEVNRRTGLSPKRLLALFRDEVGLAPKAFWRVGRFRAALRDLEAGTHRSIALAGAHGYFDQAHFLREFRALAGSSPREYLAHRVPGSDHVSIV